MPENDLIISHVDYARLMAMPPSAELLAELDRAIVVPMESIPANTVAMYSRVRYRDETSGSAREVQIVFPADADMAQGKVSVLAPVGAALIGLPCGQSIDWIFPDGTSRRLTVLAVTHSQDASGQS